MKIKNLIESDDILSAIGNGIANGKQFFDKAMREIPAFSEFSGKALRRGILHAFTEFAVNRCLTGFPDIQSRESSNSRGYPFIEIVTPRFIMTISSVSRSNGVPRKAQFRTVRAMSNQPYLFQEFDDKPLGTPYLILVHGCRYSKDKTDEIFGGIGIPYADDPTRWMEYLPIDDLIVPVTITPEETIEAQNTVLLKMEKGILDGHDA